MKTNQSNSLLRSVVEQTTVRSTAWIGHYFNETLEREAGQTFLCPEEGILEAIQVYSSFVTAGGPLEISVHAFDIQNKTWGPASGTGVIELQRSDAGKWIALPVEGTSLRLKKGKSYGFRLRHRNGLVGIGETPVSFEQVQPAGGQEWNAINNDNNERYFSYLSLAFKIEMRA